MHKFPGKFLSQCILARACQEINPFLAGKQIHYQIGRLFISKQVIYKDTRNNSPTRGKSDMSKNSTVLPENR